MEWCCISRPNKERESYFKNISNRNLEVALKQEINKKLEIVGLGHYMVQLPLELD